MCLDSTWTCVGVAPFCLTSFSLTSWAASARPISIRPSPPTSLCALTPGPPAGPGCHSCFQNCEKNISGWRDLTWLGSWDGLISTLSIKLLSRPGHVLVLHHLASLRSPEQVEPPEQERYRSDLPLPQLLVQLVQDPQLDQVTTSDRGK